MSTFRFTDKVNVSTILDWVAVVSAIVLVIITIITLAATI